MLKLWMIMTVLLIPVDVIRRMHGGKSWRKLWSREP